MVINKSFRGVAGGIITITLNPSIERIQEISYFVSSIKCLGCLAIINSHHMKLKWYKSWKFISKIELTLFQRRE